LEQAATNAIRQIIKNNEIMDMAMGFFCMFIEQIYIFLPYEKEFE
jgi:hypothetical protein